MLLSHLCLYLEASLPDPAGAHTPLENGHWYTFRFARRGGKLAVELDGRTIFQGVDMDFAPTSALHNSRSLGILSLDVIMG